MSINLKDTTYLLNNGFIMRTKGGNLWRCGKGYRKDWTKLIGKEVLLHNKPYILTNRVKKNNKWYLVFTDGQNNYTELQTKALHNKNLAKDTIIEVAKRVIAGLLTAPKELIDIVVEEINNIVIATINKKKENKKQRILNNPLNYTKKGTLRKQVENGYQYINCNKLELTFSEYSKETSNHKEHLEYCCTTWTQCGMFGTPGWQGKREIVPINDFTLKCSFIGTHMFDYVEYTSYSHVKKIATKLKRIYHPDNQVTGDRTKFTYIKDWAFQAFTRGTGAEEELKNYMEYKNIA